MVYMGSKAKITDYIVPVIQSHIAVSGSRTYIEPYRYNNVSRFHFRQSRNTFYQRAA